MLQSAGFADWHRMLFAPQDAAQDEVRFERHLEEEGAAARACRCLVLDPPVQADLFAGQSAAATAAALKAGDLLWATSRTLSSANITSMAR